MRHGNISVFVPHVGCTHRCSFCDQSAITGAKDLPIAKTVLDAVHTAVNSKGYSPEKTELAFFGGSFTAIEKNYMLCLLNAAQKCVNENLISGIRLSTRPDAIDNEILRLLKSKGVTAIELGCQSLDDNVLKNNFRGHTERDVEIASKKIKNFGFSLGLQMMTGLYTDTDENSIKTAEKIIFFGADTVRIYPTLVLKNTYLCRLYEKGMYVPQSVEQAVNLCAQLLSMFSKTKTKVIRLGLHSVEKSNFVAGPWHPAFGELCEGRLYLNKIISAVNEKKIPKGDLFAVVPYGCRSKAVGHKKCNVEILKKMGYNYTVVESGQVCNTEDERTVFLDHMQ